MAYSGEGLHPKSQGHLGPRGIEINLPAWWTDPAIITPCSKYLDLDRETAFSLGQISAATLALEKKRDPIP